jgi:site-specific DNA recombinase
MKTAAIYARVSTDEQANNYSLPSQIEMCREYCQRNGYQVVAEYTEDFSGAELDRPELNKVLELAAAKGFNSLVLLELDRLARDVVKQHIIESDFKRLGVAIEYVLGDYPDTPEGNLNKNIRSAFSQFEREKIKDRTQRGRRNKARSGNVMAAGIIKYGYRVVKDESGRKSTYEIVEHEAEVITQIFHWYTVGDETGKRLGQAQIARRLSDMNIPTRFDTTIGHKPKNSRYGYWNRRTVCRIIDDEGYTGTIYFGKSQWDDPNLPRKQRKRIATDPSKWIPIKIPAIISRETWELAQQQIAKNKAQSPRNNVKKLYLMRSRLRCCRCGYGFRYMTNYRNLDDQGYYYCGGTKAQEVPNGEVTCHGTYGADKIDALVWDYVADFLKNPDRIMDIYRQEQIIEKEQNTPIKNRIKAVNERIEELEAQRAELLDLYLNKHLPKNLLDSKAAEIDGQVKQFRAELRTLESQVKPSQINENDLEGLLTYCEDMARGIDNVTFARKREIIELLGITGFVERNGRDYTLTIMGAIPTKTVTGKVKGQQQALLAYDVPDRQTRYDSLCCHR